MLRFYVILKEALTSYNCRAVCAENQAQDVIFTCDLFAEEVKCAALTCFLCQMGKSETMKPGAGTILCLSLGILDPLGQQKKPLPLPGEKRSLPSPYQLAYRPWTHLT